MAGKNENRTPPTVKEDLPYEIFKKDITIWQPSTILESKTQALDIFICLKVKAREVVVEIGIETLNK